MPAKPLDNLQAIREDTSMNNTAHMYLAALTLATADYESAWRHYVASTGDERDLANRVMGSAHRRQETALSNLAAQIGAQNARAIHGALIQAAAKTNGVRPVLHQTNRTVGEVQTFIEQAVAGEAGV